MQVINDPRRSNVFVKRTEFQPQTLLPSKTGRPRAGDGALSIDVVSLGYFPTDAEGGTVVAILRARACNNRNFVRYGNGRIVVAFRHHHLFVDRDHVGFHLDTTHATHDDVHLRIATRRVNRFPTFLA
jgi:hypothetical protein